MDEKTLIIELLATMHKVPGFVDGFGDYLDKNDPELKVWLKEPIHRYLHSELDRINAVFRDYPEWCCLLNEVKNALY
jgi:hypothetical protein